MNKNTLSVSIIIFSIIVSGAIVGSAMAQTQTALQPQEQKMPGDIQFPVPELGNCTSMENCKIFCDNSKNTGVCLKFAEERNLLSPEELAKAKKFEAAGMVGPGGCKGQAECDKYCGNPDNMEACMTFAVKNGMMDPQKQAESEKVLAALKRGVKPPACNGPEECDKYCSSSAHMEECMNFSIEAGIMDQNKIDESKKVLAAIKRGVKMPACSGPTECDTYCATPAHMEECINFGIESGMMPAQEKEKAQKMLAAIKQGINPPACKGEQECQKYCAEDSHVEECIKFAVATGGMNEKDAAMAIKTRGKGPGGCAGSEECKAFCDNPDNQETCFNFGMENGMVPQDELKKMQDGQQRMKESLANAPAEVLNCLSSSLDAAALEKMKAGTGIITQKSGEAMNNCFTKFAPQGMMPGDQQPGQNQPGQNGPAQDNNMPGDLRECIVNQIGNEGLNKLQSGDQSLIEKAKSCFEQFGPKQGQPGQEQNQPGQPGPGVMNPGNQVMPQQAGPGGCKSQEECSAYCASNPEVCKNFSGEQGMGMGGQLAPGTQMNQVPPEVEKAMQMQIQEAINNGKLPAGVDVQNFELKDLNSFKPIQGQLPFQGGPVPAPEQFQPGQNIQGQPGQQIMPAGQAGQMPAQGFTPPGDQVTPPSGEVGPPPPQEQQPSQPSSFVERLLGNVLQVFSR